MNRERKTKALSPVKRTDSANVSVQQDLFSTVDSIPSLDGKQEPTQELVVLGLIIQMKHDEKIVISADGSAAIVSATSERQTLPDSVTFLKLMMDINEYLRNTQGLEDPVLKQVVSNLLAYFKTSVDSAMETNQSVTLSHAECIHKILSMAEAARKSELVDFATERLLPLESQRFRVAQSNHPLHVRQLEYIGQDDILLHILPAIRERYRADVNMQQWLRQGLVTEAGFVDFRNELISRYRDFKEQEEDLCGENAPESHRTTPEIRGREVRRKCRAIRDVKLNGHDPQHKIVEGTFEDLANDEKDCEVFWHPHGEEHFFPDRPKRGEEF